MNNPKLAWGGMTQRLPEGFTDFSLKNIDFVEFIFRPFPGNPGADAGRDAKLLVDLGSISEDILPDEKLNNEDGLSTVAVSEAGILEWGRTPTGAQNSVVDIDDASRRTEDLGLDGLAFSGYNDPPEIIDFISTYIDHNKIFERELKGKLQDFFTAVGWGDVVSEQRTAEKFFSF